VRTTTIRLNRPRATRSLRPHYETLAGLLPEVRALRRLIVTERADVVVTVARRTHTGSWLRAQQGFRPCVSSSGHGFRVLSGFPQ
jgi:hypothetical protein